jgi:hypothetical protein
MIRSCGPPWRVRPIGWWPREHRRISQMRPGRSSDWVMVVKHRTYSTRWNVGPLGWSSTAGRTLSRTPLNDMPIGWSPRPILRQSPKRPGRLPSYAIHRPYCLRPLVVDPLGWWPPLPPVHCGGPYELPGPVPRGANYIANTAWACATLGHACHGQTVGLVQGSCRR